MAVQAVRTESFLLLAMLVFGLYLIATGTISFTAVPQLWENGTAYSNSTVGEYVLTMVQGMSPLLLLACVIIGIMVMFKVLFGERDDWSWNTSWEPSEPSKEDVRKEPMVEEDKSSNALLCGRCSGTLPKPDILGHSTCPYCGAVNEC